MYRPDSYIWHNYRNPIDISRYGGKGVEWRAQDILESIVSGRNRQTGNEFAGSSGLSVRNYRADTANGVIQLLSDAASPEAVWSSYK